MLTKLGLYFGLVSLLNSISVSAGPIIDYTSTSINSGYNLEFTLTNTIPNNIDQSYYFWGVDFDGFQSTPSGWRETSDWNHSADGGSNTDYITTWYALIGSELKPGETIGGFSLFVTDPPPTTVSWFVASVGAVDYCGDCSFNFQTYNPIWEGNTELNSDIPEPSIIALFGLGLVGLGFARRKRQS